MLVLRTGTRLDLGDQLPHIVVQDFVVHQLIDPAKVLQKVDHLHGADDDLHVGLEIAELPYPIGLAQPKQPVHHRRRNLDRRRSLRTTNLEIGVRVIALGVYVEERPDRHVAEGVLLSHATTIAPMARQRVMN